MVEQYIYSRSDRDTADSAGRTVALGYGFMGLSEHMTPALEKDVYPHCSGNLGGELMDEQKRPTPIWRKAFLQKSGKIMLQYCSPLYPQAASPDRDRMFHIAHGYIVDKEEAANPESWFKLAYYICDPNQESTGLRLDEADCILNMPVGYRTNFRLRSLKSVLQDLGLDAQTFLQAVLACFDSLTESRRVLIAYDSSDPGAAELKKQILCWMYLCMPFALRRMVGADSEYIYSSSPQFVQIAFVPRYRVEKNYGTITFRLEKPASLDGDYLVMDSRIAHNSSYESHWFGKDTLFARWLAEVINELWQAEDYSMVIKALNATYNAFDRQLTKLQKPDMPDPAVYNALCEMQLGQKGNGIMQQINRNVDISEEEEEECQLTFLREFSDGELVDQMLDHLVQHHTVPAREHNLRLLTATLHTEKKVRATHILAAFMTAEADAAGADFESALHRYQALPQLEDETFRNMMQLFAAGDAEYPEDWRLAGVDPGTKAAAARRRRWCEKKLNSCSDLEQLPDLVERFTRELPWPANTTEEQLAAEILGITQSWLANRYPLPTLSDIVRLAQGVNRHFHESDGWIYVRMLQALANGYRSDLNMAGLSNLEKLQKAFLPLQTDAVAHQCWQQLCEQEVEALDQAGLPEKPDRAWLSGWNSLLDQSPLGHSQTAMRMTETLYENMLRNPSALTAAGWPDLPVGGRNSVQSEAQQALILLNNFAKSSSDSVKTWHELLQDAPQEVQKKAREALPDFFAAGLLPGVKVFLLCYIIHLRTKDLAPVLAQAARQGGAKLLQNVITLTKRYKRQNQDHVSDLQMILEAISGNDEVLDLLQDQARNKGDFVLWLADTVSKMQKSGVLSQQERQVVIENLVDYCVSRNSRLTAKIQKYAVRTERNEFKWGKHGEETM